MLDNLTTFLSFTAAFIVALSILVAIHEFGHFYVARRCGVKVLRFSIGFGHRLYTWTDKHGTEFAFSAIPLGGYVKMLDEREGDVHPDERHLTHNSKSVMQRIAIAAAGPIANFILAIILYWFLFLQGTSDLSPVIGSVEPGSLAAEAGLEAGQEVIAVDGVPTPSRRAFVMQLLNRLGESGEISFVYKYPDSDSLTYESKVILEDWLKGAEAPDPIKGLGISYYVPDIPAVINTVVTGSAAEKAGFKPGDEIVRADGVEINEWGTWVDLVRSKAEQSIDITVLRENNELTLTLVPEELTLESGEKVGRAGVSVKYPRYPDSMIRTHEYGLWGAFVEAVDETWDTSAFVLVSMKKLILGQISTKNLSGPIGIAKVAGDSARSGIWSFVSFLAMISIYLGVLNLLPIPILDGGHIVYYLVEGLKGSPVSERIQMLGYQAGLAMILCIMVIAFYNDILRL